MTRIHSQEIGQATKAEVILSRVVQNPIRSVPIAAGQTEETKVMQEGIDKAGTYLEKLASPLKAKGRKVRCNTENVDLIVMSTHNEGDLYKSVVGSIENMNGKLDTNWLGVPKEGYGFSNGAIGVADAPSFSAASFPYDGQNLDLTISLYY